MQCDLYTDVSGGSRYVHNALQQVGAGAAWLNIARDLDGVMLVWSAGVVCSSVPGRQTVPRAEMHALASLGRFLRHTSEMGRHSIPGKRMQPTSLVVLPNTPLPRAGTACLRVPMVIFGTTLSNLSHASLDAVCRSSQSWLDFVGNSLADCAAAAAAAAATYLVLDGLHIQELEQSERIALLVLIRAASAAEALAREYATTTLLEYELHPRIQNITTAASMHDLSRRITA